MPEGPERVLVSEEIEIPSVLFFGRRGFAGDTRADPEPPSDPTSHEKVVCSSALGWVQRGQQADYRNQFYREIKSKSFDEGGTELKCGGLAEHPGETNVRYARAAAPRVRLVASQRNQVGRLPFPDIVPHGKNTIL